MEPHTSKLNSLGMHGWLERKQPNLLLGTHWKKGYWVLDCQHRSLEEYKSMTKEHMTLELDPKDIRATYKQGAERICLTLRNGKDIILRAADETSRNAWIDALTGLFLEKSADVEKKAGDHDSKALPKSIAKRTSRTFRFSSKKHPQAGSSGDRPVSSVETHSTDSATQRDPSAVLGADALRDTDAFMGKARNFAVSTGKNFAESVKKKGVNTAIKLEAAYHRMAVVPSSPREAKIDASKFIKTAEQKAKLEKLISVQFADFPGGESFREIELGAIVDLMYAMSVPQNTNLVTQGQSTDRMYVIESGVVGVYSQDFADRPPELEVEKRENDFLGVLSLLYKQPAPFTIRTHSDCVFWALPSRSFHELTTNENKRKVGRKIRLLEKVPLIAENVDASLVAQLAESMDYKDFLPGEVVLKYGEPLKHIFVVVEGVAVLFDETGDDLGDLDKGDVFGEWALLDNGTKSDATIIADTQLSVLVVEVSEVEELVGPIKKVLLDRWVDTQSVFVTPPATSAALVSPSGSLVPGAERSGPLRSRLINSAKAAMQRMVEQQKGQDEKQIEHANATHAPNFPKMVEKVFESSLLNPFHHTKAAGPVRPAPLVIGSAVRQSQDSESSLRDAVVVSDRSLVEELSSRHLFNPLNPRSFFGPSPSGPSNRLSTSDKQLFKNSDRSFPSGATKSSKSIKDSGRSLLLTKGPELNKEEEEQALAQITVEVKRRETMMRMTKASRSFSTLVTPKSNAEGFELSMSDIHEADEETAVVEEEGRATARAKDLPEAPHLSSIASPMQGTMVEHPEQIVEGGFEDFDEKLDEAVNLDRPFERCPSLRPELIMSSIECCALLGRGSFGRVHLARSITKRTEMFALKVMSRHFIVTNGWEKMVENERDAMNELAAIADSPFLLRLWNSFTDSKNIYLLLEVCEGGDLFKLMKSSSPDGCFTEEQARFYMGCVVLGLHAMHALDIIYRDLKPENLMVTRNGYVKLADFGLAKKTLRTFTVCGTPEYMAPETLLSRGHNSCADWWAAGILQHELMVGVTPFCGGASMEVYEAILAHDRVNDLKLDDAIEFTPAAKDLLQNLLHPKKNKRLGVKFPGIDGIKSHDFFKDFNWTLLEKLGMDAPVRPDIDKLLEFANQEAANYDAKLFAAPDDHSGWTLSF